MVNLQYRIKRAGAGPAVVFYSPLETDEKLQSYNNDLITNYEVTFLFVTQPLTDSGGVFTTNNTCTISNLLFQSKIPKNVFAV